MAEISTKQQRAVAALLSERTIGDAAKAASVGERTLARWVAEDASFQRALQDAQSALIDSTVRNLARLSENATTALEDSLAQHEPTALRLRAATVVLDKVLQYKQLIELEKRVATLEGENDDNSESEIDED